jgi:hypothetical protein
LSFEPAAAFFWAPVETGAGRTFFVVTLDFAETLEATPVVWR